MLTVLFQICFLKETGKSIFFCFHNKYWIRQQLIILLLLLLLFLWIVGPFTTGNSWWYYTECSLDILIAADVSALWHYNEQYKIIYKNSCNKIKCYLFATVTHDKMAYKHPTFRMDLLVVEISLEKCHFFGDWSGEIFLYWRYIYITYLCI